MNRLIRLPLALFGIAVAFVVASAPVNAADIKDGRAIVVVAKDTRFSIDSFTFGKAELFGYMSELKDTKNITGIVLKTRRGAEPISDEHKRIVGSVGNTLQLETFVQVGKALEPIVYQQP